MNINKFLVTGAAGFIGLNTCEFLLNTGHIVIGIDNFCTSCLDICSPVLTQLKEKYGDRFKFHQLDLNNSQDVDNLIKNFCPEYIIHLAAIPSVSRSVENPLKSIENNVITTTNIAVAASKYHVERLVYAGSSSYYGGRYQSDRYFPEESYPMCKSPYAASKAAGELIIRSFSLTFELSTSILRYFNVFGPYQNSKSQYSAVIPAFITALMKDEPPIIYGSGLQSRDFTYVKNIAYCNYMACVRKNASNNIFDIGCGVSTSLLDLLSIIQKIMGTDKEPIFKPAQAGDVSDSRADLWCTRYGLNYQPLIYLKEGLIKTVKYYTKGREI